MYSIFTRSFLIKLTDQKMQTSLINHFTYKYDLIELKNTDGLPQEIQGKYFTNLKNIYRIFLNIIYIIIIDTDGEITEEELEIA